jgi:flagellar biosynthesis/type III secretory pathway protein FliH
MIAPELELTVKVFNINEGRNAEMLKKSETLHGYAAFVGKVRGFVAETGSLVKAMPKAIDWCIRHGILSDFLETNGSEVRNMLLTEWNWDDALRVREQDGVKRGIQQGIQQGIRQGIQNGLKSGREEVARNALAKGLPLTVISDITGLDTQAIMQLAAG